ncbi:MAG: periplasmic heavy metal sensor [Gammaproteobacteria bacterium]|nr:periplasmic heavy metal sensor [Gammaproteobacteria bacterium]MDE2252036.1 periplasmic heavy metal sensor [Gammaproteobacteria bacterium]
MKKDAVALVILTFAVAVLGGWLGVRLGQRELTSNLGLDQVLHHDLSLTKGQERRIEELEASFSVKRKSLESEMRAANRELAQAMVTEHRMSPAVEQAIGHFHVAMRQLQELTTAHVLSMREELTPPQAAIFDRSVVRALDADGP